MKNIIILLLVVFMSGCYRHVQTHGRGPDLEGTIIDKHHQGHFYLLFGIVDLTGPNDIDGLVKKYPDCRVTTEQNFIEWLIYSVLWARLIDERMITIEFPVDKDSKRGRELIAIEKKRRLRLEEAKLEKRNER